jgi:hypothetical protein
MRWGGHIEDGEHHDGQPGACKETSHHLHCHACFVPVCHAKLTFEKTACWNTVQSKHTEVMTMEMFGRVGLVEIPILIAPDQKVWMDKMIKEGKIAIPPGGTLEKGSLYSMFIRMLLHNAMEEQKRQEALEADDEDDE